MIDLAHLLRRSLARARAGKALSLDEVEALLSARGHILHEVSEQGVAQGIIFNAAENLLEGGSDRRRPDGAAIGR